VPCRALPEGFKRRTKMTKIKVLIGTTLVIALAALQIGQSQLQEPVVAANDDVMAPHFLVDPLWPKPLPNHWVQGNTIGVDIDERDHIFAVHRNTESQFMRIQEICLYSGVSECCTPAPPILEFDLEGNLINAWGGPVEGAPYTWPPHALMRFPSRSNSRIGGAGVQHSETPEYRPIS
jgi:hypothetical protein